jgi:hypothetical protein
VALLAVQRGVEAAEPDVNLVLTKGPRLERLSVSLKMNGRPASQLWDDHFAALVEFFDRDGNGLTQREAERLPSAIALREVLGLGFVPQLGGAPEWKELDDDSNGTASVAEVGRYYRRRGAGMPQVAAAVLPLTDDLTASLLRLLDTSKDQMVDESELQASASLVAKLDRNDDELVGPGELVPRVLYPGAAATSLLLPSVRSNADGATSMSDQFAVVLPWDAANMYWSERVLAARDVDDDGKLSAEEAGVSSATFKRLDSKGDGLLSAVELQRLRKLPPDHRYVVEFLTSAESRTAVVTCQDGASATRDALPNAASRLVVRVDDGRMAEATVEVGEHFSALFAAADAEGNGIATAEEIAKHNKPDWRWLVPTADRDDNSELSRAELDAWLAVQQRLAAGQVMLTLLDAGEGLFELLDTNHDGALSHLEFRDAAAQCKAAGCLVDGRLAIDRIPRTLLVTISPGYHQSSLGKTQRTGPAWFLAMDRNGDEAISPREFSGPIRVFQNLDKTQDGFVTAQEAANADR